MIVLNRIPQPHEISRMCFLQAVQPGAESRLWHRPAEKELLIHVANQTKMQCMRRGPRRVETLAENDSSTVGDKILASLGTRAVSTSLSQRRVIGHMSHI